MRTKPSKIQFLCYIIRLQQQAFTAKSFLTFSHVFRRKMSRTQSIFIPNELLIFLFIQENQSKRKFRMYPWTTLKVVLLFYFIGTVEVPLLQLIAIDFDWKLSSVLDELIWKMYCHGNPPTVVVFLGMIHRKIDLNFNENWEFFKKFFLVYSVFRLATPTWN